MNDTQYRFFVVLKDQFEYLFKNDPRYRVVAEKNLPSDYAGKFIQGLADGTADKDGTAIKNTCKALGLKCTYKAIQEYFNKGE
jgi:hypothetical protein